MAKENVSICPEKHTYASEEERMCPNEMCEASHMWERFPNLDCDLRWICPVQENFAVKVNIYGLGERISKRFWLVGFDEHGLALSIRSIGVRTLLDDFDVYGIEDAPLIPITYDNSGHVVIPEPVSMIHIRSIEDKSWIHDDGFVYSVKHPVTIKQRKETAVAVYFPHLVNGELQAKSGYLELIERYVRFYSLIEPPTDKENNLAVEIIGWERCLQDVTILTESGVRFSENFKGIIKCHSDIHESYVVPNSVRWIRPDAFNNCINLVDIFVSLDNPSYCSENGVLFNIEKDALVRYPSGKHGAYEIPNGIKRIESCAFYGCVGLTSVTIPETVTRIAEDAFVGCNQDVLRIVDSYRKELCERIKQQQEKEEQEKQLKEQREREEAKRAAEEAKRIAEEKERQRIIKEREAQEQKQLQAQQMQELLQGSTLFFDTETTGVPKSYNAPASDSNNWPRLVQLAWLMTDKEGKVIKQKSVIIKPNGFSIPQDAASVHGITTERAQREGLPLRDVLEEFTTDLSFAEQVVGHNIDFDRHIVGAELYRLDMDYNAIMIKSGTCTMKSSTDFCAIPNPNSYYGGYKWPSLQELYRKLFNHDFVDVHDALADITATKECFFELKRRGIIY